MHSQFKRQVLDKSRLYLTSCTILKNRQDACSTRKFTLCGTGILPVHKKLIENGATSQLYPTSTSRTGILPVPQENSLFVEQASCLFIKSLLRMVQPLQSKIQNLKSKIDRQPGPKPPNSLLQSKIQNLKSKIG